MQVGFIFDRIWEILQLFTEVGCDEKSLIGDGLEYGKSESLYEGAPGRVVDLKEEEQCFVMVRLGIVPDLCAWSHRVPPPSL